MPEPSACFANGTAIANRIHHLVSDWESRLFYLLEWSRSVQDIREQYLLVDLDLAIEKLELERRY